MLQRVFERTLRSDDCKPRPTEATPVCHGRCRGLWGLILGLGPRKLTLASSLRERLLAPGSGAFCSGLGLCLSHGRLWAEQEQLRVYSREALARLLRWIFHPGLDAGGRVRERQQHLPDRALSTGLCDVHPSGPAPFADCAVIQLLFRFAVSRCLYTVPGRVLGAGGGRVH